MRSHAAQASGIGSGMGIGTSTVWISAPRSFIAQNPFGLARYDKFLMDGQ